MNIPPGTPKPPPLERRAAAAVATATRRQILAAWRGVDLTPWERAGSDRTRRATTVVAGVLQRLRLEQRRDEVEIVKVWNRLLDPHVAAHAQPVGLRRGTLFIRVNNSAWLSELVRYRQGEILERLQA